MTRGLSSAQTTAVSGRHVRIVPLLEAVFDSGVLRLAMGPFSIVHAGNTYSATGPLLTVKQFNESATSTQGIEVALTGLDAAVLAIATNENYRGRILRIIKAVLDADTNQVIGLPVVASVWRMKSMSISESNDQCTITVLAEHYDAELKRPSPIRFNDADQQRLYPGDKGCEYAATMSDKKIVWPTAEAMKQQ